MRDVMLFVAGVLCAPLIWLEIVHALLWWAIRRRPRWEREPEWFEFEVVTDAERDAA